MLPAFLTTLLFAISAVSANRSTRMLGGIQANFWRISLATLLLAAWAHGIGSGFTGRALPYFLISGCIGFGFGDLAFYQALPRLGSRLSVLIVHCLAAPLAAVVEWIWLGTTLTRVQIFSSLVILIGVGLALAPGRHLNLSPRRLLIGIVFGLVAAAGQGVGAVFSRKAYQVAGMAGQHIDGLTAAYQRIVAGWFLAAFAFFLKRRANESGEEDRRTWRTASGWVLLNAVAGPTLGVGCFQWALSTRPTGVVLPIVATTPIVVIPFARVIEGEHPRVRSLVGGAIAVAGAVSLSGGAELLLSAFRH